MDSKQARELIDKYIAGTCTPEEKELLESIYSKELDARVSTQAKGELDDIKASIWAQTSKRIKSPAVVRSYARWLAAAASVILILSAGYWLFQEKTEATAPPVAVLTKKTLEPAIPKAMLTLADGTSIALDDADTGEISRQAGRKIIKSGNGRIVYAGNGAELNRGKLVFNTLSTPRAAFYRVTLSDGSQAWLNAESSITYPAAFGSAERAVSITGEVYFEIAKDPSKPFLVSTGGQTVRVLGTHFNVMAYTDEARILTTLLEGSIEIDFKDQRKLLRPGYQAAIDRGAKGVQIRQVNAGDAVAWKNGDFKFDNEPLAAMMNKIARWYDVEIVFKDNIQQKKFWGTYSRSKSLENLLNSLEQTEDVHFNIQGRKITIMK